MPIVSKVNLSSAEYNSKSDKDLYAWSHFYYENMPIQIYRKKYY